MIDCLTQYYRCPERFIQLRSNEPLSDQSGYFRFGESAICYGRYWGNKPAEGPEGARRDSRSDIEIKGGITYLPFEPCKVVDNLRYEKYVGDWRHEKPVSALAQMYYFIRPILPLRIRSNVQKIYFRNWDKVSFPHWPVDTSVDNLLQQLLILSIRCVPAQRIPFIWFWPEGATSCAIMTHDVETLAGREFCSILMDIDDSFGIKASFQVIPEERYGVGEEFLSSIRDRGFEVVVHDLNHDGHLYRTREQFLERAAKINGYGKKYGATGFRAGVLYRKQLWYDALDFAYDMSVPNVAHLDPQHGGCCTVMPYFIGEILELPVTTSQDYTLFNILNEYSPELWKRQTRLIMKEHGLMSFIIHPDYIGKSRERGIYEELLRHIVHLKEHHGVWMTTPGEVNHWWRQRAKMHLVENGNGWRIVGEGSERARIVYASERHGDLVFAAEERLAVGHLSAGAFGDRT